MGAIKIVSTCILLISIALPIFFSEQIGGWTKKYTSPVKFTASQVPNLTDKVAVVTGANTGIGYVTALELARANATVVVAARNESKGIAAVKRIQNEVENANVYYLPLDLASLDSVHKFANLFLKLDLPLHMLILNAGVMKSPGSDFIGQKLTYGFETTNDGFEYHIGVNHVAHAYLATLMLPKLKESGPSRIVSVSSTAEQSAPENGMNFYGWVPKDGIMHQDYEDGAAYGQSKLANIMYTKELSKRLQETGVSAYSLHPGVILSEINRYMEPELEDNSKKQGVLTYFLSKIFGKLFLMACFNVEDGALTQLYVATTEEDMLVNGGFYHPIGNLVDPLHVQASNETLSNLLWEETEKAIKQRNKYTFST